MATSRRRATRRRAPRVIAALVALVVVVLVVVTLVGRDSGSPSGGSGGSADGSGASSDPTASGDPTATPPPPRPQAGACRQLGYDAAGASTDDTATVPCRRPHTALTVAVEDLPRGPKGGLMDVAGPLSQARVASGCRAAVADLLGGSVEQRRLSMLEAVWFLPTEEELAAGADWYRCDVVALAGPDRLAPLTGVLRGIVGDDRATRYAVCGTAEPGAADFERVVCSAQHSWRAISTVDLASLAGRDGAYPGPAAVREAGQDPCQTAGQDAASDPLQYRWGYEWPTRAQWGAGQTYGVCWAPA